MSSSLIGRNLGKYEIVSLLGQGGMATVYKGYQHDVARNVAIKVLPPHPGQSAGYVERFQREARAVGGLQHPHILPLYDYGMQDDILYLVMPFIDGGSLADRLKEGGPLPLDQIERILRQVASALDYAHKHDIIHRDIKPDNILLDGEGNAMLADFGIVKIAEGEADKGGPSLTVTGGLLGTPAYMAPEQAQGLPVGKEADIYSLGVVVYQMLTGKHPYTADTPAQVIFKHITEPTPRISEDAMKLNLEIPDAIEPVMLRVLAKDPLDRYPSATEFVVDLVKAARGHTTLAGEAQSRKMTDTMQQDNQRTWTPGSAAPAAPQPTATSATVATAPTDTLAGVSPGFSRAVLLGGLAVVALLIVVVILLVASLGNQPTVLMVGGETSTPAPATQTPLPTTVPVSSFGRLSFGTSAVAGDTVNLRVEDLALPPQGQTYAAWLVNTADDSTLLLGALAVDSFGTGVLAYTDPAGQMLPTLFNAAYITLEESIGDAPQGEIKYSAYESPAMTAALNEILVMSDAGSGSASLADDIVVEAGLGARHAGLASGSGNVSGMQVHAEHTVNILRGTREDLNGDGSAQNPGRGYGVLPLLDHIEELLDAAADAPDASSGAATKLEPIRVCLTNSRHWVETVIQLEQEILSTSPDADVDSIQPQSQQATTMSDYMVNGDDLNANGQIEAFEEECGLEQVAGFALLMGTLNIVEGPPAAVTAGE